MLKRFFLGLLVAWAAAGFLYELNAAVASYDQRERAVRRFAWRFGAPEPARLDRCLRQAETEIPPGSTVAFASPDVPPRTAFQSWRWAAYLLPDRDVLDIRDPAAGTADLAISYRMKIGAPRFEPVRRLPGGCWLYRVRRP
jgi:hypothetical protein